MRDLQRAMLLLTLIGLVGGCDSTDSSPPAVPRDWQTIRAGTAFSFKAPPDLKSVPVQGVDSFVGSYASPTLEVMFDYGWYSNSMNDPGHTSRPVEIDGKQARLISKDDVVAIHFPKVDGATKLTMSVRLKGADATTAEMLLQSIDFP
jgi:hypothetical protein